MHRAAELVEAVLVERVVGDRGDGAQIGEVREELIAKTHMRSVQRAGFATIETFAWELH